MVLQVECIFEKTMVGVCVRNGRVTTCGTAWGNVFVAPNGESGNYVLLVVRGE